MRIAVGLDSTDSPAAIKSYIDLGADEFFVGYIPPSWYEWYGWEVSPNRRAYGPQCQFTDLPALRDAVGVARSCGKPFSLTLNAHEYGPEQAERVHRVIDDVEELSPDAYIVADPGLMLLLDAWGIKRPLHLSTGAACFNSETVRFYCERFDVKRVVLPRKLSLNEMRGLIAGLTDLTLEFEAMVIGYRCFFNDEFCFAWHSDVCSNLCCDFALKESFVSRRFPRDWKGKLSEILRQVESQFSEGSTLDRLIKDIAVDAEGVDVAEPDSVAGQGPGMNPRLAETLYQNCGLCAVPHFRAMGVDVLKVPSRGTPLQKAALLRVVNTVADHPEPTRQLCRELINSPGFCGSPGACYYELDPEP